MRLILCFALCLAGCSNHLVRCDTRLQPINSPGTTAKGADADAVAKERAP